MSFINKIINIDELQGAFYTAKLAHASRASLRATDYAINRYVKEGRIIRVKRGMYARSANPFYIASMLFGGYVGFSSALYLHGLKPEIEATVTVCTQGHMVGTRFMDKLLLPVNMSDQFYGYKIIEAEGLDIPVSTFPKIVFDMFFRPKHANFYDMYNAMNNREMSPVEWKALLHYAREANLATQRRMGYGLENKAPGWFTAKLLNLSKGRKKSSFFLGHRPDNYNPKWGIFDDINIRRWENAV